MHVYMMVFVELFDGCIMQVYMMVFVELCDGCDEKRSCLCTMVIVITGRKEIVLWKR